MAPVVEGDGKSTHPVTAYLPDVTTAPVSPLRGATTLDFHSY